MTKAVYVLVDGFEGNEVVGVFTTLEKLKRFQRTLGNTKHFFTTMKFLDLGGLIKGVFTSVIISYAGVISTKQISYETYDYSDLCDSACFSGNLGSGTKLVCRLHFSEKEAVALGKKVYKVVKQRGAWNNHNEVNQILKELTC